MKSVYSISTFILLITLFLFLSLNPPEKGYIRINQVGYLPDEPKISILFSNRDVKGNFILVDIETGKEVYKGRIRTARPDSWANFNHYFSLNFSELTAPGQFKIVVPSLGLESIPFKIGAAVYGDYTEDLLGFMRQQRCGYNPFLDVACHQKDGRTMYGALPDSSFLDVAGGWHDAGDQLKYLITSSFATGFMLLSYELEPSKFADLTDDLGRPLPNGLPDVVDEARWGLDWLHKVYSYPEVLVHQVADDRDHVGFKWPQKDPSDYGWGSNSYRVAYIATGKPQGLGQYKSQATGLANLAGRTAAAFALGYRVFQEFDSVYADLCLRKAITLYEYGKQNEGYQQGNSYGAPYRYNEETWADDMEWAAAELYKITGKKGYLDDAYRYARLINVTSWMELDSASHYQYFPFINLGHFALYESADARMKQVLAGYYRSGIEKCRTRAEKNPFSVGVPFIWCSNFLVTALVSQIILYERMTGDVAYHELMTAHVDWLLGRNPWGTSMFMNIPAEGEYPQDVHTSTWAKTGEEVPGGLVDGPVFASIYNNLLGLELTEPDEFETFQNNVVVYHDDIGDYSTNEPTMDGTASGILMMATFGPEKK